MPRDRPFLMAGERARPYSEIVAERQFEDPDHRARQLTMSQIAALEAEAADCTDPDERKRLQCEAEGLRCALTDKDFISTALRRPMMEE